MNRRKARENAFIAMFELGFGASLGDVLEYSKTQVSEYTVDEFGEGLLRYYDEHTETVDAAVAARLKGWTLERLPRVSLAILRLAATEMAARADEDIDSVVINEAVELSKKYGDDSDYQFINGVLGSIAKSELPETEE